MSALANPNRCKVEIGLMQEGSARAGIIVIGGIFFADYVRFR